MCIETSIDGTAVACGFLKKKGCRSQYRIETGVWRNASLVNQEKFWSLKVRDDVTCFSNGCCNVLGHLVETALQALELCMEGS
jgi:hypothetical protein